MRMVKQDHFKALFQSEKLASMSCRIESVESTRSQKAVRSPGLD